MQTGARVALGESDAGLVESGVARYPGINMHTEATCDEPLAYLALDSWVRSSVSLTERYRYFAKDFKKNTTDDYNGFESFMALYFAHAFSSWRKLDEVFSIHELWDGIDLSGQNARLVAFHRSGDTGPVEHGTVSFSLDGSSRGCTSTLGYAAKSPSDVLAWLRHQRRVPFCFPSTYMRPDILFCLEIEGIGFLWVALQCKFCSTTWDTKDLEEAIQSVTPSKFFLHVSLLHIHHSR